MMTATTTSKTTTTKTTTTTTTKPTHPSKTMTPSKLSKTPLPPPLLASARGTPFERAVWQLTYQIPAGCFSTYALLAAHLKSSPRAVGNALRRNPFAPEIPCHRVIATGGTLGGFKGKIGRRDGEGITLAEKRALLRKEGVKLEGDADKVRVLGTAFRGFV
ncbi:6-O-methylguanine DNA methyltransferase [Chaetomium fimeti]|uniref:Methylated-DNA--protein-cysteine methyltransferase n=1 Tax=Chaetomium fimeti TaxID=1854472 RepID=A0AAE0HJT3_9PEZI|nr:6-O-methylguanine DNA methyltransferase [Chaetomium fimeti]